MKYLLFSRADGLPAPEDLAVMQRECPGWVEEMNGRGVRLLGAELDMPLNLQGNSHNRFHSVLTGRAPGASRKARHCQ
jgi:hypothetical protein